MRLKILLFNLSVIIFIICLIYLFIYINYKYEGFINEIAPIDKNTNSYGSSYQDAITSHGAIIGSSTDTEIKSLTTDVNYLNSLDYFNSIKISELELSKDGSSADTAFVSRYVPFMNRSRRTCGTTRSREPLPDGYYWVSFVERSSAYVYCIMDEAYFGGGWMLAMRGVKGSRTFGYNSDYWTTDNTLSASFAEITTALSKAGYTGNAIKGDDIKYISSIGTAIFNNYQTLSTDEIKTLDIKTDAFNKYNAKEWLAIFYYKDSKGGDIIKKEYGGVIDNNYPRETTNINAKGWLWYEPNIPITDRNAPNRVGQPILQLFRDRTPSQSTGITRNNSFISLKEKYGVANVKEMDKFKNNVGNTSRLFSSQSGFNFYGINYDIPTYFEKYNIGGYEAWGTSTRWGFSFNNENDTATNDVNIGIGLSYPRNGAGYSAGDIILWNGVEDQVLGQSIAFEWYVR